LEPDREIRQGLKIRLGETVHSLSQPTGCCIPRFLVGGEAIIRKKAPQRHLDRVGDAEQHVDGRFPASNFDVRDIGRANLCTLREFLLAQAGRATKHSDPAPELAVEVNVNSHSGANLQGVWRYGHAPRESVLH
jgi:hypothetical protein